MAATVSDMHATRAATMRRTMQGNRDLDGNILNNERCDVQTYAYGTGGIPAYRYENLMKAIALDGNQAVLVFHQLAQGKINLKNE